MQGDSELGLDGGTMGAFRRAPAFLGSATRRSKAVQGTARCGHKFDTGHASSASGRLLGAAQENRPGTLSLLTDLLVCHLLFVLMAGLLLLLALPVARIAGSTIASALVAALWLTVIVQYQRVARIPCRIIGSRSGHRPIQLPESYVAGLTICHFAPLLVLLYALDGALWLQQQAVTRLATADELVLHEREGVYKIEQARTIPWLGQRDFRRSLGNQQKTHANQDRGTSWRVEPLVSGSADREQVSAAITAGSHCVWLGSNRSASNEADRPSFDHGQYLVARDTRAMRRYLNLLSERLERSELPPCTRIVEQMDAPEVVMQSYRRDAILALTLAHGIPLVLMLLFSWFSGVRRDRSPD